MSITHGAALLDKLGLKRRKVKATGRAGSTRSSSAPGSSIMVTPAPSRRRRRWIAARTCFAGSWLSRGSARTARRCSSSTTR
eukprot:6769470-Prymnesium_polylepis.1